MNKDIFKSDDSLKLAIDGFFDDRLDPARAMMEQVIARNLLYYMGEQYIEYVVSTGQFRKRQDAQLLPTPVSNEIREYVRSVVSMLMNQKMVPRIWPNTDEKEDIQAADIGQALLNYLDYDNDASFFDEKEKTIILLCLSGTTFMRTYADSDSGMAIPDGGRIGGVATESILPFNVRLDPLGDTLRQKRWIGIQSLKDKEWVEDTFKTKIEHDNANSTTIDYQRYISKLVQSVSPWKGRQLTGVYFGLEDDDSVLFREVEFKPTTEHPDGLYVVICGNKVIYKKDRMLIKVRDGAWHYSLTDFHYNRVPGRFWSDPGVNDLISPQNIINEIDQALAINRMGIGKPKILSPGDVGLKKIGIGGHGFIALSYNPIMGQKPEFKEGTSLAPQVLEERKFQKMQMQDAAGDPKNVLRGQQPSANASGVLTEGMREAAERGRYPDIERFNRSLARVYKKRLLIAQEVMTEERMIKTLGRGNKIKITKFKASDLRGNTDVRLELDSSLITSKSGQAQFMLDMIQSGFFREGEIAPTVRQEVLQRLGISTFSDEINNDVERAETENLAVASGEVPIMLAEPNPETGEDEVVNLDPLFKYDNHKTHYEVHRKYMISPEFAELPQQYQTILVHHTDLHQKMIQDTPPDIRDYVQIDKILLPGILKESERAQVVEKYLGIKPGDEPFVGIPDANSVIKINQKIGDTEAKMESKDKQMKADLYKHGVTEGVKANALQAKENEKGIQGGKPKPPSRIQ